MEAKEEALDIRKHFLSSLQNTKVSELEIKKKPVVLESDIDPKKAIELLIQNKVRAAPVREKNQWIGVLDLRDTVKYALETYRKAPLDKIKAKAMEYFTISPNMSSMTLSYLSRMRPFRVVTESDPLLAVAQALAKGSHIVGVLKDDKTTLTKIITQGQLFQYLAKKWSSVEGDIKLQDLAALKFVTTPVITIRNDAKAYEAFEKMSSANLSGLAVIDEKGRITHNTSATDIKLWLVASNSLVETIEQFLITIQKLTLVEKYPITVCTMDDGLKKAIGKLQATGYHRLWIVDEHTIPIGVLALTDIFAFIVGDINHNHNNPHPHPHPQLHPQPQLSPRVGVDFKQ